MLGLPVYMGKPVLEPWFRFDDFVVFYNGKGDWADIERHLQSLDETQWMRIKLANQRIYDRVMAPERVAEYFIQTALQ